MYSGAEEVVFLKFIKEIQQFSHVLGSTWAVWPGIIFFFFEKRLGRYHCSRQSGGPAHSVGCRLSLSTGALFSFQKNLQNFSHFPSHRIFRRMHGVLNIDKNKN
jgi:hypothetical protein